MHFIFSFLILFAFGAESFAKSVSVSEEVNTSGYSLKINEVHEIQNELYVLATLKPPTPNSIVLTVISTVSDTVTVETHAVTHNIFILTPKPLLKPSRTNIYISNKKTFNDVILKASKLELKRPQGENHVN
jgi:hypothetical protein